MTCFHSDYVGYEVTGEAKEVIAHPSTEVVPVISEEVVVLL